MLKRCSSCAVEKPLTDFAGSKDCKDGRQHRCRKCSTIAMRVWRAANPDKARAGDLKHRYGLSVQQYDAILVSQRGACAICEKACATGRRLAVDHDHNTGCVRGLLCAMCNTAIGKLGDSPALVARALTYLLKE